MSKPNPDPPTNGSWWMRAQSDGFTARAEVEVARMRRSRVGWRLTSGIPSLGDDNARKAKAKSYASDAGSVDL